MGKLNLNDEQLEQIAKSDKKSHGNTLSRLVGNKKSANVGGGAQRYGGKKQHDHTFTFRIIKEVYEDFSKINTALRVTNADVLNGFIERYVQDYQHLL